MARRVAVLLIGAMLLALIPPVFAATTTTESITSANSTQSTGSPSDPCPVTNATSGPCLVSPNTVEINFTAGIIEINGLKILVPYLPLLPLTIPGGFTPIGPLNVPSFPTLTSACNVDILNPLTWGNLVDCITKFVAALAAFFPSYIYAVVSNGVIGVYNDIGAGANSIVDAIWNVFAEAVNVPIAAFDDFTLGTGALMLYLVLALPEPFSAFLTPFIWLFVIALILLIVVAAVWVGVKVAKGAEDTAEFAVDLA